LTAEKSEIYLNTSKVTIRGITLFVKYKIKTQIETKIMILSVVFLLFGGKKLPEFAKNLGKDMR